MGFFQQVSGPFDLPKLGGPAADDWMLPKTSIKFVPGRVPQPVGDRRGLRAAAADRRPARGSARSRSPPSARPSRSSAKDPEKWRPEDPRDGRPQPALLHGRRPGRRRITAEQFTPERLADPALLDLVARTTRRRGPAADRRLSRRHPQPRHGHPRRRHARSSRRSPSPPATTRTRSPTTSSPTSSTAWSTRSWAATGPIRSARRVSGLEKRSGSPHQTVWSLARPVLSCR